MTAEDLLKMPDDGFRYELVKGELRQIAPAGHEHGSIVMNISAPLALYVKKHKLGRVYAAETGFYLQRQPDTVRAPDVAFVSQERLKDVESGGFFPGAPDLAIEVISPSDVYSEVEEKVAQWLEAGTQMVVIVNPKQRTARVHCSLTEIKMLTEADILEGGELIPGWTLPLREIFE